MRDRRGRLLNQAASMLEAGGMKALAREAIRLRTPGGVSDLAAQKRAQGANGQSLRR